MSMEILKRLHNTGKYEIAEHSCYIAPNDPKIHQLPWTVYGNLPINQEETNEYNSKPFNQFGEWRFNDIIMDFKGHVVIGHRDLWMIEHLVNSPFRPLYHLILYPAIDAGPHSASNLAMLSEADSVLMYTDWAKKVLEEQTNSKLKIHSAFYPGVDLNTFKPVQNKGGLKKQFGFTENTNIIGTTMRSQARKLYPDLFKSFSTFLQQNENLRYNTFLWCHLSYPDVSWDHPTSLKDLGIASKVVFTYFCHNCGFVFPSFFQEGRTLCKKCGMVSAYMPNTQKGVSREILSAIMNSFDIYIQYASSESLGIPSIEAAACSVPLIAPNYSAMGDVVEKLKGYKINVKSFVKDPTIGCDRAVPDNDHLVQVLTKFFNLPEAIRLKKARETRILTEQYFDWDKNVNILIDYLDSLDVSELEKRWKSPPKIHQIPTRNNEIGVPAGLTHAQMVDWSIRNILGEPEKCNTFFAEKLLEYLNFGSKHESGSMYFSEQSVLGNLPRWRSFQIQDLIKYLYDLRQEKNLWEARRTGLALYSAPTCVKLKKREI